ncbi:hypothetical protein Tco_0931370 [Tanacetum coccineum]
MALHSPWCPSRSFSTLDDFGGFMDCQHGKPMWGVGLWDCEVFGVCGKSNEVTEVGYGGLAGNHKEDIQYQNQKDLPRDNPLVSVEVFRYDIKRSKSKNRGIVPTEMELVLEQTQQGTRHEVSFYRLSHSELVDIEKVAVSSSLQSLEPKRTIESRAKKSSINLIRTVFQYTCLSHTVKTRNILRVLGIILVVLLEHPSDTYVFTMKMEILLEPISNKLYGSCETLSRRFFGILPDHREPTKVYMGRLKLLDDFYVIDMDKDPATTLLVRRGFLETVNAVIDRRKTKIAVGEGVTKSIFRVKEIDLGE